MMVPAKLIALVISIIMALIITAAMYDAYSTTAHMQACVNSGKIWVRTSDWPYEMECRR